MKHFWYNSLPDILFNALVIQCSCKSLTYSSAHRGHDARKCTLLLI